MVHSRPAPGVRLSQSQQWQGSDRRGGLRAHFALINLHFTALDERQHPFYDTRNAPPPA